ncbi:MAG: hypothetical protein V2J07_06700 [Anaerolineae bacterium]|nr:hypothetical protein [Anaerolineae bacterium]
MKKFPGIFLTVVTVLLMTFGTVAANANFMIIKGTVTEIVDDLVTIETKDGETYPVHIPEDFNLDELFLDDDVMAKVATKPLEDGTWRAIIFQILEEEEDEDDQDEDDDEEEGDEEEGTKLNAAFCNAEKKDIPHPLAVTLAAEYGVEESWVMDHYCNGMSIGEIRLALKTSSLEGVDVDADTLLEMRQESGWGQIWKELKLVGNDKVKEEKERNTPPGQLKKEEKDKDKEK